MRTAMSLLAATILVAGALLVTPAATANPGVPYCPGHGQFSEDVPATGDPATCEAVTGRVFPEALQATDFVSFYEFEAGLRYLEAQYPDYLTIHVVGESAGLADPTGAVTHFPIYMLEITNELASMPLAERQSMLFMLSIHGNEKGGREGGFRVLEDLLKGIGFAAEPVQDGAGLPEPITTADGQDVVTYHDYLDFQRIFLLFPNADGWAHDEPEFFTGNPVTGGGFCGTLFCRTNGNGVDLNRQAPTMGWQDPSRNVVGEPESIGYYNWILESGVTWDYAIDIHGMLNHQNFVAIMMPAASMTPQEMQRSVRLAETLKERMNSDPHFNAWTSLFAAGEQGEAAAGTVTDPARENACIPENPTPFGDFCPVPGSALANAGSSTFAEYYTVIDAIGYTDSGFNGDFFAQDTGLNAPGYDIELAYNHITVDSQYSGAGAQFNDYHVHSVREITKSFMDAAALDVRISFETQGTRTLYVEPTFVATNADDETPTPGGWADQNSGDDLWDYGPNDPFFARPAKYWEDLKPFVRDGDLPGVLVKTTAGQVDADRLAGFDNFVIPGSAIQELESDPAAVAAVLAWVADGGNLVLTDEALRFFDLAGLTDGAVDVARRYMGGIKMDLDHPLLAKVRGGVKQTYEPTPIGFQEGANDAPNWYVDAAAYAALGGSVAGIECGTPQLSDPCTGNGVALGEVSHEAGTIRFMGALLPDPTEEYYHPYGLDDYATTYSGNQVLRNLLGWDELYAAPPVVITAGGEIVQTENEPEPVPATGSADGGSSDDNDTPAAPAVALLAALAALAVVTRRRRA